MPGSYAHIHFGREVAGRLPKELREAAGKYSAPFAAGLQGPDIFFFYRFHFPCRIVNYGLELHYAPAAPFFRHGVQVVRERGQDSAEYAYLLGCLCHYVLDSECHPYVRRIMEEKGLAHLEIEEEFEKLLLRLDGEDPFRYRLAAAIPTDRETAKAISRFYQKKHFGRMKPMSPGTVRRALWYMCLTKKLFYTPGPLKHGFLNLLMRITGQFSFLKGLLYQHRDNPACAGSNEGLLRLLEGAVGLAVSMAGNLDEAIREGTGLDPRFGRNFE